MVKGFIAAMVETLIAEDRERRERASEGELVDRLRKATPAQGVGSMTIALARALRALVNAPLPSGTWSDAEPLDPTEPFWVACRGARELLRTTEPYTGVNGEKGP